VYGKDIIEPVEKGIPQLESASEELMFGYAKPKQTCGANDQEISHEEISKNNPLDDKKLENLLLTEAFQKDSKRCRISFEAANKLWNKKKAIFVDVRSPSEYQKSHIPNSLNIPLYQVRTKDFLKKESIVIVDNGYFMSDKLLACMKLKQSGYSRVSILEDGLLSWRNNNGELVGNYPEINLVTISPDQYNKFSADGYWVIIDASNSNKNITYLFPSKEVIRYSDLNIDANKNIRLSEFKSENKKINYLIIGLSEKGAFNVDRVIKRIGADLVFSLSRNINDYQSYISKQKLLISKAKLGPVRVKPCGR
jgi:rhodanese-related sulfurtransferase